KLSLIFAGLERHAAALRNLSGKSDHLVECVLAGESPDERLDGAAQLVVAFAGAEPAKGFEHHGHHDVHPSGTNERECAVEVEYDNARIGCGRAGMDSFHHVGRCGTARSDSEPRWGTG